jgi:hypothetical protein
MAMQFVIEARKSLDVEKSLGDLAAHIEIFPMGENLFGVSIPTKLIDEVGEQIIQNKLKKLRHFELWEGAWKGPRFVWKFL